MVRFGNLFLAQSAVNTMADLKTAVGHGLGIIVIISYVYAVILIIMACVQEFDARDRRRFGAPQRAPGDGHNR
jgi:hypothetical protein